MKYVYILVGMVFIAVAMNLIVIIGDKKTKDSKKVIEYTVNKSNDSATMFIKDTAKVTDNKTSTSNVNLHYYDKLSESYQTQNDNFPPPPPPPSPIEMETVNFKHENLKPNKISPPAGQINLTPSKENEE